MFDFYFMSSSYLYGLVISSMDGFGDFLLIESNEENQFFDYDGDYGNNIPVATDAIDKLPHMLTKMDFVPTNQLYDIIGDEWSKIEKRNKEQNISWKISSTKGSVHKPSKFIRKCPFKSPRRAKRRKVYKRASERNKREIIRLYKNEATSFKLFEQFKKMSPHKLWSPFKRSPSPEGNYFEGFDSCETNATVKFRMKNMQQGRKFKLRRIGMDEILPNKKGSRKVAKKSTVSNKDEVSSGSEARKSNKRKAEEYMQDSESDHEELMPKKKVRNFEATQEIIRKSEMFVKSLENGSVDEYDRACEYFFLHY